MNSDKEPSGLAVIIWTVILILLAGAAAAFACGLVLHTPLPRHICATCLGVATALILIRWLMQRFER